jgi:hypothetical protein
VRSNSKHQSKRGGGYLGDDGEEEAGLGEAVDEVSLVVLADDKVLFVEEAFYSVGAVSDGILK